LNDKALLVKVFTGATAAFAITNYWEIMSINTEIQQGRNLVDAVKVISLLLPFCGESALIP
jgi:hypothetical protein